MARYDRSFRRENRKYAAGGTYGRGFGRPRHRQGHGYGAEYRGGPGGEYGYEYGGRGTARPGAVYPAESRYAYEFGPRRSERGRGGARGPREGEWRPTERQYQYLPRRVQGGAGPRAGERGGGFGRPAERYRGYGGTFQGVGYGTQFGGPSPATHHGGRAVDRFEEPEYGYTPSSRWPEDGHDVDHLTARDRAVTDRDVRNIVHENLSRDHWLDTREIDVDVEHGVVTLTGDVNDYMEARYAWDDAWESPGVRGVINNLTVRTDQPSSEMDMPQTSGRGLRE